jgi:ABC-type transport system involved in cytochrome c biogenesis permease subunit
MAFKLLRYIGQSQLYSLDAIAVVTNIRYCVIVFSIFTFTAGVLILIFHDKEDDPAGFISLCIITILLSILVAIMASLFEKKIRKAIDLKSKTA